MTPPVHILVVATAHPGSSATYPHAASLARAFDGRITLLCVDAAAPNIAGSSDALIAYMEREHGQQEAVKADGTETFARLGCDIATETVVGLPAEVIPSFAEEHGVDCILMARADTEHDIHVFGETLRGVLRRAGVPVLVVPAESEATFAPGVYRRILAPTAFGALAESALDVSVGFAHRYGADVVLFHAVEPPYTVPAVTMSAVTDVLLANAEALTEPAMEAARQRLVALADGVRPGTAVKLRVDRSDMPHDAIDAVANEEGADIIVMAAHTRGAVERFVLGSTAEDVIHGASTPVLVLPEAYLSARAESEQPVEAVFARP